MKYSSQHEDIYQLTYPNSPSPAMGLGGEVAGNLFRPQTPFLNK